MTQALVTALREWFAFDTWSEREGLLLLAGIDPHHADAWTLTADGWKSAPNATWAAIGQPPSAEWRDDGPPVVRGLRFVPDEAVRLFELTRHWRARPDDDGKKRHPPAYFVEWARSKKLPPSWLSDAQAAGIDIKLTTATATELPDPQRRLARLRQLGGDARWFKSKWETPGIGKLVKLEKGEGRERRDQKTIRADLIEAAEAEAMQGKPATPPSLFPR
jgi:hypothetical protein